MKRVVIFALALWGAMATSGHAQESWKEQRSAHFIIYYKDAPTDFVENIKESAERYYRDITRDLGFTRYRGWSFDERAKVYIYSNREDYLQSAQQAGWSHGVANAREKTIRTFPAAHGFFDSTLPHELGHIIFREFVGFDSSIPLWLDEGVAMFQERARRWGANRAVKAARAEEHFIPLTELSAMRLTRSTPKETVNLYYAEAASVVYYMITELGKYRFVRLCRNLKDGQTFDRALTKAYSRLQSLDDLNRVWVRYIEEE